MASFVKHIDGDPYKGIARIRMEDEEAGFFTDVDFENAAIETGSLDKPPAASERHGASGELGMTEGFIVGVLFVLGLQLLAGWISGIGGGA